MCLAMYATFSPSSYHSFEIFVPLVIIWRRNVIKINVDAMLFWLLAYNKIRGEITHLPGMSHILCRFISSRMSLNYLASS